jgi:3'-phosphoadenosine 5'-phosphosulfate sulfotransferase (PAPS reductase)/FAD synthetase
MTLTNPENAKPTKPKRQLTHAQEPVDLLYIAFGGGVQSTALALLWANRDPRLGEVLARKFGEGRWPDLAIFADTGDEPEATYAHVWRCAEVLGGAGLRLDVVHRDEACTPLGQSVLQDKHRSGSPPVFLRNADGSQGVLRRECTENFKIDPINRHLRALLGAEPGRPVRGKTAGILLGISTDEAQRADASTLPWLVTYHPLLWMGWSRGDCLRYLESQGFYDVPKSACVFCPYRKDAEWGQMKREAPQDFARACAFDEAYRAAGSPTLTRVPDNGRGHVFLHRSLKPLAEIDFTTPTRDLFEQGEECTGHCWL